MSGSVGFALELLNLMIPAFCPGLPATSLGLAGALFLFVVFRTRIRKLRGFLPFPTEVLPVSRTTSRHERGRSLELSSCCLPSRLSCSTFGVSFSAALDWTQAAWTRPGLSPRPSMVSGVGFAVTKWGAFQSGLAYNDQASLTLVCYSSPLEARLFKVSETL